MSADKYDAELAAWMAKHAAQGEVKAASVELSTYEGARAFMIAQDAKSKGKSYCWRCGEEFPICEMIVDMDPYIQDEDRPERSDCYIPQKFRVRTCKPCHDDEEKENAVEESEP